MRHTKINNVIKRGTCPAHVIERRKNGYTITKRAQFAPTLSVSHAKGVSNQLESSPVELNRTKRNASNNTNTPQLHTFAEDVRAAPAAVTACNERRGCERVRAKGAGDGAAACGGRSSGTEARCASGHFAMRKKFAMDSCGACAKDAGGT